jgi:non-specific serine/threonine protein kinase
LALELMAARLRHLSAGTLLARLERRLPLLTGGPRDVPARHQTVHAALDWSHDLLSAEEQTLFRRLAVFAGGWTLAAAEVVCDFGSAQRSAEEAATPLPPAQSKIDVLERLTHLADQSLVNVAESPGGERFHFLVTLRDYAEDKLRASGEMPALRQRHAEYFLRFAEVPDPEWRGGEYIAWLERLEGEHDNLRAALQWFVASGRTEQAMRLGAPLGVLWRTRSYITEGQARLRELLALPDGAARPAAERSGRSSVLISAGRMARTHGDYATARSYLEQSIAIGQALGNLGRTAIAQYHLGNVLRDAGDAGGARPLFEQSLDAGRHLADTRLVCASLFGLGGVAIQEEDYRTARRLLEESVTLSRPANRDVELSALCLLGAAATELGDVAAAHAHLEQGLQQAAALGNQDYVATILDFVAALAAAEGHHERALRLYGAVDALNERLGAQLDASRLASRRRWFDRAADSVPAVVGAAARAEGRAMSTAEAIAYVLAITKPAA